MSGANLRVESSHSCCSSIYSSYLITRRHTPYFRITIQNTLRSVLGKYEIRRSSDAVPSRLVSREAQRLSVVAKTFFAFAEDVTTGRVQFKQENSFQKAE